MWHLSNYKVKQMSWKEKFSPRNKTKWNCLVSEHFIKSYRHGQPNPDSHNTMIIQNRLPMSVCTVWPSCCEMKWHLFCTQFVKTLRENTFKKFNWYYLYGLYKYLQRNKNLLWKYIIIQNAVNYPITLIFQCMFPLFSRNFCMERLFK